LSDAKTAVIIHFGGAIVEIEDASLGRGWFRTSL